MGCSAQDQVRGYKALNKKATELNPKVDPERLQFAINEQWLGLENNIMTQPEKDVYRILVAQSKGVAILHVTDSKQIVSPLVMVKDIGKEYSIHLENGQNYAFEKGKVKSKTTKAGRTVTMPAMELTDPNQGLVKGSDANARIGETETDVATQGFDVDLGNALLDIYVNMYDQDLADGVIGTEGAKFSEYYRNPAKFEAEKSTLTEFEIHQVEMVKTYMETMKDLESGNVAIDMFDSEVNNTAGSFNSKTQEIKVRRNVMSRLSSSSEVFLHEVNHKMSQHVFADNLKLKRLMTDLRNAAVDSGATYELFLEGIEDPTEAEIKIAKMKYEYTFDKTADIEEFYAYATTNKRVFNAIKDVQMKTPLIKELKLDSNKRQPLKIVINRLIEAVNVTWRLMSGRGVAGGQLIADMVQTIAATDAEMQMVKEREAQQGEDGVSAYAAAKMDSVDEVVKPIIEKVADWSDKLQSMKPSGLNKHIAKIPALNAMMDTGISQYLWRTVTQDTTKEGVAEMYMVFRHSKQVVEKHTTDLRNGVKTFADTLYKDVDKRDKEAVRRLVLEADLAQYTANEIKEILKSDERVAKKIKQLEADIVEWSGGEAIKPDTIAQMNGLAKYMATGESMRIDQQMNAHNIAHGVHLTAKPAKGKLRPLIAPVEIVDKIVTLKAVLLSDKTDRERLQKLLETEQGRNAVDSTINMYRGYIDNMRQDAEIEQFDPIPKGYVKPANGLLRYELVPKDQVKAQESVLMKLAVTKPYMTIDGIEQYLMVGKTKSVGFTEGAIGLISHTTEGIPLSQLLRKKNDLLGKKRVSDQVLKEKTSKLIDEVTSGRESKLISMLEGKTLVPVYDHNQEIVDYRVQLNKLEADIHLPDRETDLEDVLSSTFSRSIKTSLTATENKRVIDTIIMNTAQGVKENPEDYVLVEEYTKEDAKSGVKREKRHDRWDTIPDHTKNYIYSKTKNKGILIHKDFVELMTGEKDMTVGNFAALGFEMKNHPVARARMMAMEAYITEVLGYVKQAMIVLNGDILVGNQVSNAMVAASHGINPVKYTKKFKERWGQLDDYNEKVQMLAQLEVEQMAGKNVGNKIKQLKRQLEGNIWDELVKDGQYTALVEDINIEKKMDGQLATIVQDYIDKNNFKGIIEGVRNGLYIDKTSALYATMLKTVHYGDAITRQIIKEELEEKAIARDGELQSKNKQDILNYLDQLLVNYGYIQNRWWNYADKTLGLFFMKYYLNQPKALMAMSKKNPTKIALMQGLQVVTGFDIADPVDTYTNSGLDGIGYRMMMGQAPGLLAEPNILELIPSMNAAVTMR